MLLTLETVYEMKNPQHAENRATISPTFIVTGAGAVDMYVSNASSEPANYSAMTKIETALTADAYPVIGSVQYICFVQNGVVAVAVYEDNLVA